MTINIALTSYPRRISNCVKVINSVLSNTVQPDRIYLTLSHLEFPNYEQSLPQDLYNFIMTSNKVILNWVEDNTKSMKKIFPILPYLEDEDVIIDIDDDMILPEDFMESRLKDFRDNGCKNPITSHIGKQPNMDNMWIGCYSLFQKKMLNGWEKFVTDEILNTFNDDRTYLYLCHMNGYKLKPCTKYSINRVNGIQQLDIAPRSGYSYKVGQQYDDIAAPIVSRMSGGRKIDECFGLFNEPIGRQVEKQKNINPESKNKTKDDEKKTYMEFNEPIRPKTSIDESISRLFEYDDDDQKKHDLVYVLGKGSKNGNMEIKISITSMLKFCSHWVNHIYVVGENPHIKNPMVTHVYAPDITISNKDANIIYKILTAIKKCPRLTENFLFCSDDILVTKKSDWDDFAPRTVFEYIQDSEFRKRLYQESKNNEWDRLLLRTLDRFVGKREHVYFYEPHIFAPINRTMFRRMCGQIDYAGNRNVMIMSLWFNWLNLQNPQTRYDHQSVFTRDIPDMKKVLKKRHLTYNDAAFNVKEFRDGLIELVTMDEFK